MPEREKPMKLATSRSIGGVLFAAILCVQCSKHTDFLYETAKEPPTIQHSETKKVKEMDGNNAVDVLWVIDNSGSMGDKQTNLINNTTQFIGQFVQNPSVDWKMGIISTDTYDQPYVGFVQGDELNWKSTNPVQIFQTAVGRLGTSGSGIEKSYEPIVNNLTRFPNFVRPGAFLAIIIVTDEDEQSNAQSATSTLAFLKTLKGDLKNVLGYGVFADEAMGCSNGFYYSSSHYAPFMKGLKNRVFALCSPNFGQNLATMGADIVQFIQNRRFALPVRPIPGTLKVLYKGTEIKGGPKEEGGHWIYDYDLNVIIFLDLDFAPGQDEEIQILYEEKREKH
jgi:hypothetical protein